MIDKYLDVDRAVEEYITQKDWRVKENANLSYSFSSIFFRLAGESLANYTLRKIYPKKIAQAHLSGDFHIHNLYMGITGYCAGWSLADILTHGFNGVLFKIESFPPKHLSTALLQIANFVGTLQGEWSGAQAFNALDVYLAPYVRKDNLSYKDLKQHMQQFIYNLNIASRWGGQTPFTNITFELKVPEDLEEQKAIHAGKLLKARYKDFQDEIELLNKAFLEVMLEGDMHERIFTFPIPTYNLTKDFNWSSELSARLFELTAKFGAPYFQNFINSNLKPSEVRAMCCRLRLDLRQFYRRIGGYFGYADKTGSIGVVTINLPRIGYLAKDDKDFFQRLEKMMLLAKESLEIKRRIVQKNIDKNLFPFTKRYLGTLRWHFSTIGIVGGHETCINFLGKGIYTNDGKQFAIKLLRFMREKLLEFQEETGNIYNLEATPGEGVSYRLAKLDKKKYPKLKTSGTKAPYYTNSTHLPVNYTDDLFKALEHQEDLQLLYTGGTVFHCFIGERIDSPETCKLLVRRIAENFKLPYFTVTPTFSICQEHGYLAREHFRCPSCKSVCEVYSRVVGYYRPVQNWNDGKREEFRQRKKYLVSKLK